MFLSEFTLDSSPNLSILFVEYKILGARIGKNVISVPALDLQRSNYSSTLWILQGLCPPTDALSHGNGKFPVSRDSTGLLFLSPQLHGTREVWKSIEAILHPALTLFPWQPPLWTAPFRSAQTFFGHDYGSQIVKSHANIVYHRTDVNKAVEMININNTSSHTPIDKVKIKQPRFNS